MRKLGSGGIESSKTMSSSTGSAMTWNTLNPLINSPTHPHPQVTSACWVTSLAFLFTYHLFRSTRMYCHLNARVNAMTLCRLDEERVMMPLHVSPYGMMQLLSDLMPVMRGQRLAVQGINCEHGLRLSDLHIKVGHMFDYDLNFRWSRCTTCCKVTCTIQVAVVRMKVRTVMRRRHRCNRQQRPCWRGSCHPPAWMSP